MPAEEAVDLRDPRGGDADPRAVGEQEATAQPPAERIAGEVAERGGQPGRQQDDGQADASLGGDHAAEDDRGLTGRDEAHERAGLQEGEAGDQRVGPGAERLGETESPLGLARAHPGYHQRRGAGARTAAVVSDG